MRLAIVMNLAPRKLGSFEDWIVAMCRIARERGHEVEVLGRTPIHPTFRERLDRLGAGWDTVDRLLSSTIRGIRRLASHDAIHLNMFAPRSRLALMASAAYPARVLFVDHTSGPVPGTQEPAPPLLGLLKRAADLATMVRVDGVAGVSRYVTDRDRKRFGLKGRRARTIYNGVDVSRFAPSPSVDEPHAPALDLRRDLTVLAVAHLIHQKGVDHLIRALACARNQALRLVIAGDGPEQANLAALAAELGVADRVELAGLRDDVPALLARADLFVHPAVWEEAFGLTIAEAMASGRAVIATRVGGIPELIEHRRTGLLVQPGNAGELARALDLLSDRPALRRQLAENARVKAQQAFGLARCALDHVRWCEESVAARAAPGPRSAPRLAGHASSVARSPSTARQRST